MKPVLVITVYIEDSCDTRIDHVFDDTLKSDHLKQVGALMSAKYHVERLLAERFIEKLEVKKIKGN